MTDLPVVPTRRRRTWVTVGIAALVLLAGIAALATMLIDTDAVRHKVERRVSAVIGGDARYGSIALGLLPRPRASIRGLHFSVPDVVEGRAALVDVQLALLPLLAGDVRIRQVRIEQPELAVQFATGDSSDPWSAYRTTLTPVVDALVREAQGLSLEISSGKLDVMQQGRRIVALSDVAGTAEVSADAVLATVSAASDQWRSAQASLSVAPGTLAASAKLKVAGLDAGPSLAPLLAGSTFRMQPGPMDGTLDVTTDGRSSVRGSLTVTAPRVSLSRAERSFNLGATGFTMDFSRDATTLALAWKDFHAGDLLSGASGLLRARADGSAPVVELQVRDVDLARAREAVLALIGQTAAARAWITPVSAGTMKELVLRAAADDFAALGQLRSIRAEAGVDKLAAELPAAGVAVRNMSGRLVLEEGRLQATGLAGIIGKSSLRDGALTMTFAPVLMLQGLAGGFDADLGEVLAVARQLYRHRPDKDKALSAIESLQGRVSGSVAYGVQRDKPHLALKTTTIRAGARLRNVPFPLEVSQGAVDYTSDRLMVRGLAGSAGRSRLQGITAEIMFGGAPAVRAASGSFSLAFDELYPWLASLDLLREPLKGLSALAGDAEVDLKRLSGILAKPDALDFEAAVRPKNLRISGKALPGTLTLVAGMVDATPRNMRLDRLAVSLLDAKAVLSGAAGDYALPTRKLQLAWGEGLAGPQSLEWMYARWQLPQRLMLRAPVALPSGKFEWKGGEAGTLVAQGNAGLAGGTQAGFDVAWQPGRVDLRHLTLKDADSDATLAFRQAPAAVETAFRGQISNRSIERILAHAPPARGSVEGDFQAVINLHEPRRSTATGKLEGEGIDIFERWGFPVVIDRFRVEAADDSLQLRDSSLRLSGQNLALSGSVRRSASAFVIDARANADQLDLRKIMQSIPRSDAVRRKPAGSWDLPFEGKVAVTAGSLAYEGHTLRQVDGVVTLAANRIVAEAKDAQWCDVKLPFTAVFVPDRIEVSAQPSARGADVGRTLSCLAGKPLAVTGTYDLDAQLSASGQGSMLLKAARGDFRLEARAGRISGAQALDRTLALDEVAGRMETAKAQAKSGSFDYDRITAAGRLESGRLHLDNAAIDSQSLGVTLTGEIGLADQSLAMQGLVAPLDKMNRVVRRVPIVGGVLGASIVVVPVSVTGSFQDPKVKVLEAAAVGATLINLMATTFKAPIQLLDSAMGKAGTPP